MGERESQTETAASVRAALESLGKSDASMLLHRVQVRGWLADAGIRDRAVLVAFGELASEGVLYAWWHGEGVSMEDATRTISDLGMDSALPRALLAQVLAPAHPQIHTVSPGSAGHGSGSHRDALLRQLAAWSPPHRPLPSVVAGNAAGVRSAVGGSGARARSERGLTNEQARTLLEQPSALPAGPSLLGPQPRRVPSKPSAAGRPDSSAQQPSPAARAIAFSRGILTMARDGLQPKRVLRRQWVAARGRRWGLLMVINTMLALLFAGILFRLPDAEPCSATGIAEIRRQLGLSPLDGEGSGDCMASGPLGVGSPAAGSSSGASAGCPARYVRIAPGQFPMGSPTGEDDREGDETQHHVTITRAFCMKATEVTQGEWQAEMGDNPSFNQGCGPSCPVERVSWDDAVLYANALSRREGLPECYTGSIFSGLDCGGYRLPTESEWEYAARAGTTGPSYGLLESVGWFSDNSEGRLQAVGIKSANSFGLYDMLGNVWEWTNDWYDTYPGTVTDPTGPSAGSYRVIRGGAWRVSARVARAAYRSYDTPDNRDIFLGFRLARTVP